MPRSTSAATGLLLGLVLLAGCKGAPQENESGAADEGWNITDIPADERAAANAPAGELVPPAPGELGGLPDDRRPLSEGPIAPSSGQAAAQVVQSYYALLESGREAQAWKLWSDGAPARAASAEAFARQFDRYADYHAQIGAPGRVEGAAGSLYVEVPVVIYGRLKSGAEIHESGTATLRRVNDVPGSTEEQRSWRIYKIETTS